MNDGVEDELSGCYALRIFRPGSRIEARREDELEPIPVKELVLIPPGVSHLGKSASPLSPQPTIVLDDAYVSKIHAELCLDVTNRSLTLKHRSAQNPTSVNGQDVLTVQLKDGDVIQLGKSRVEVAYLKIRPQALFHRIEYLEKNPTSSALSSIQETFEEELQDREAKIRELKAQLKGKEIAAVDLEAAHRQLQEANATLKKRVIELQSELEVATEKRLEVQKALKIQEVWCAAQALEH